MWSKGQYDAAITTKEIPTNPPKIPNFDKCNKSTDITIDAVKKALREVLGEFKRGF